MTEKTTDESTAPKNVLKMHEVAARKLGSKTGRIRRFSLTLRKGEVAMIHRPARQQRSLLVDTVLGFVQPRHGWVSFLDSEWQSVTYRKQLAMRSNIGRIFEEGGWISNLSMPDNLKLMKRHHTTDPDSTTEEQLQRLAKQFKIEIPQSRISFISSSELRVCQWIRALAMKPKLLIAESPLREVPDELHHVFCEAEYEHRKSGGATIWITTNPFIWQRDLKGNSHRHKIDADRLRSISK